MLTHLLGSIVAWSNTAGAGDLQPALVFHRSLFRPLNQVGLVRKYLNHMMRTHKFWLEFGVALLPPSVVIERYHFTECK